MSPTADIFDGGASGLDASAFGLPQGLGPEWTGPWPQDDAASLHLSAAYQADVASKCAAGLASHIQYLWGTVMRLQGQVTELEDWKKKALDEVRKLRDEHKVLKRCVLGDDGQKPSQLTTEHRAKTMPQLPFPGLVGTLPPGLAPPLGMQDATPTLQQRSSMSCDFPSSLTSTSLLSDVDGGQLEGVQLSTVSLDGVECERAEWRIGQLSTKLRGCMGRALVSSPFSAAGLEELRLMVCPDGKETAKGPRSKRQKEQYSKKVIEGPLDGCLKLKVSSCPPDFELQYYLKVGSSRRGPFTHNFSDSTVSGCDDFGVDWLTQLESDSSLVVCVEIVKDPKQLS